MSADDSCYLAVVEFYYVTLDAESWVAVSDCADMAAEAYTLAAAANSIAVHRYFDSVAVHTASGVEEVWASLPRTSRI